MSKDYAAVLEAAALSQMDDSEMVSAAVIAFEYIDADGALCLAFEKTPGTSPWQIEGMLRRALRHFERLSTPTPDEDDE